jgi:D-amino peptidase
LKIYLSTDIEGTAGIVDWSQVRPDEPGHAAGFELLLAEINASIEGAQAAGASEFLVNDAHSTMNNLPPARLAGRARYLSGRVKPLYMMEGLDASFDAAFFISYHGSMSAPEAVLSHTYFPMAIAEVTLNGIVVGEAGINALVARHFDVPVVLITGDEVTAHEISEICPGIRSAVVKRSVNRFAADSMHPDDACALIREEARLAVAGIAEAKPPAITLPATLGIRFHNTVYAELSARVSGVVRTGDLQATITHEDPLELFATFVTMVLLCRGFVE